ncbi:hypothetical protein ANAEL_03493 [Anaerolineales bacterium]|nr:hypothetical protein ANAEL_03493 [Anaerolineales bacterium]
MNSLLEEYMVEERRRDVLREMDSIRLQEQALKARVYHPNWFTRAMQSFGEWLIARGESLVERYEMPRNRVTSSRQGYAH